MHLGQRFLLHQWSDGCAVFDLHTGNTHSLDLPACSGFIAAQRSSSAYEAILESTHSLHPDKTADEVAVLTQSCFERLEMCGLIDPENKN